MIANLVLIASEHPGPTAIVVVICAIIPLIFWYAIANVRVCRERRARGIPPEGGL